MQKDSINSQIAELTQANYSAKWRDSNSQINSLAKEFAQHRAAKWRVGVIASIGTCVAIASGSILLGIGMALVTAMGASLIGATSTQGAKNTEKDYDKAVKLIERQQTEDYYALELLTSEQSPFSIAKAIKVSQDEDCSHSQFFPSFNDSLRNLVKKLDKGQMPSLPDVMQYAEKLAEVKSSILFQDNIDALNGVGALEDLRVVIVAIETSLPEISFTKNQGSFRFTGWKQHAPA